MARNVDPIARLYQQRSDALRKRLAALAVKRWRALPDWSEESNRHFARAMAADSTTAQEALLGLLESQVSHKLGRPVTLDHSKLVGDAVRETEGGMYEAWQIPMRSAWKAMAERAAKGR